MPLLPHIRLLVPDGAPRVTAVSELPMTRAGLCWVAYVRLGERMLGTIENAGTGETEFFAADDDSVYTWADFAAFAADCRRDGAPLDPEAVMELLVEEFDCASIVRDVHGHAGTYARQTMDGRITGWAEVDQRPRTHDELMGVARQLSPRPAHGSGDVAWQVWTGRIWRTLPIPDYD
ncbi:hypothetical protein GCM10009839_58930 [Catenulispora yoronensis]|uniref:Uncharacterized protein n=1 Tax=Catenulispora yoronensis TaxID=450799 RepID=A0ABP5GL39_9ACTN